MVQQIECLDAQLDVLGGADGDAARQCQIDRPVRRARDTAADVIPERAGVRVGERGRIQVFVQRPSP